MGATLVGPDADRDGLLVLGLTPSPFGIYQVRLDTDRAETVTVPPAVVRSTLLPEVEAQTGSATLIVR